METFDDKSEGKTFIHRPKNHVHKIFNFGHTIWRNNLKFLYNNCMLLFYFFRYLSKIIYKKMQRIEQNKNKKFF